MEFSNYLFLEGCTQELPGGWPRSNRLPSIEKKKNNRLGLGGECSSAGSVQLVFDFPKVVVGKQRASEE